MIIIVVVFCLILYSAPSNKLVESDISNGQDLMARQQLSEQEVLARCAHGGIRLSNLVCAPRSLWRAAGAVADAGGGVRSEGVVPVQLGHPEVCRQLLQSKERGPLPTPIQDLIDLGASLLKVTAQRRQLAMETTPRAVGEEVTAIAVVVGSSSDESEVGAVGSSSSTVSVPASSSSSASSSSAAPPSANGDGGVFAAMAPQLLAQFSLPFTAARLRSALR
jgi:hypothetical protein